MRRKKSEVTASDATEQGVTLTPKHGGAPTKAQVAAATPSIPVAQADGDDGLIDLDPEPTRIPLATAIANGSAVELSIPKPKRKYTKRAKKSTQYAVVVPSFVDRDAIRSTRINAFVNYIDGNISFETALEKDTRLKALDELAREIMAEEKA